MIIKEYIIDKTDIGFINKDTFFFDIETLGLNKASHEIILICIGLFHTKNTIKIKQYFAEFPKEEKKILEAFIEDISKKRLIKSYNGDNFDVPFINFRLRLHQVDFQIEKNNNFDIFKFLKPLKKIWQIEDLKLKTVEMFFGIERDDLISGKESILLYKEYVEKKNEKVLQKILLHNFEDVKHMVILEQKIYSKLENDSFLINHKNNKLSLYLYEVKQNKNKFSVRYNIKNIPKIKFKYYDDSGNTIEIIEDKLKFEVFCKPGLLTGDKKIFYVNFNEKVLPLQINDEIIIENINFLLKIMVNSE